MYWSVYIGHHFNDTAPSASRYITRCCASSRLSNLNTPRFPHAASRLSSLVARAKPSANKPSAVLSRQRDLSESAKDNIRSRIASTVQSASIPDNNLTKDEQQALKRLKNDDNIVILPADKGRVTVVMDKTDYFADKMDALVSDKQTYEELKRDPTPALLRKLNSKILTLKTTDAIDTQRYYRLRCSVPQPPKLYGLPKLHKPGIAVRPIVSFCGSPTYQLSKYLTTILTNQDANCNLQRTLLTLLRRGYT